MSARRFNITNSLEGTIEAVLAKFQGLQKQYPGSYIEFEVEDEGYYNERWVAVVRLTPRPTRTNT